MKVKVVLNFSGSSNKKPSGFLKPGRFMQIPPKLLIWDQEEKLGDK